MGRIRAHPEVIKFYQEFNKYAIAALFLLILVLRPDRRFLLHLWQSMILQRKIKRLEFHLFLVGPRNLLTRVKMTMVEAYHYKQSKHVHLLLFLFICFPYYVALFSYRMPVKEFPCLRSGCTFCENVKNFIFDQNLKEVLLGFNSFPLSFSDFHKYDY